MRPDVRVEWGVNLHEAHPEAFGTADAVVYFPDERLLRVIDFKYGAGVEVEAEGNLQLLFYAVGALWRIARPVADVEMVIVQPRAPSGNKVKRWTVGADCVFDETYKIKAEAEAAYAEGAPLRTGDWCRWCPAAAVCPRQREQNFAMATAEFTPVADLAASPYNPELLAACLEALPRIKAWCESVNQFAHAEAAHGRTPPGFKLVEKKLGPRKWKSVDRAGEFLVETLGRDSRLFTEPQLKSPPQLDKVGMPDDVRQRMDAEHVIRESSGVTLVHEDDPRPAVSTAESEFPRVAGEDII